MNEKPLSPEEKRRQDLHQHLFFEEMEFAMQKQFDPFGIVTSLWGAQMAWLAHPQELTRAVASLGDDLLALQIHLLYRAAGGSKPDIIDPEDDDARFKDKAWTNYPSWDILKESYLALSRHLQDMCYETPGFSDKERRRAAFWLRKWLNAVAPNNFFWLNPVALRKFMQTGGQSLWQGLENFSRDFKAKNVLMVEPDAFQVGGNLATTPGQVVYRNHLFELIHYTPSTSTVSAVPILFIPPWINKFYILDLGAKKSMIKYLVDQGFSVFLVSWKNPDAEMADLSFDDYLLSGVHEAVTVVREYCAVPQIHLVGYCIGGTLSTTYMAWANRRFTADAMPVKDLTLFTTLTDFSQPGEIEVFIDESSVTALEQMMAKRGYLDGQEMTASFRMLRSNSLIWYYWVQSYLYGDPLPPFDVLFWNSDSTRMPSKMHSFYLREMYLHNNLMKRDKLVIADEPIDLNRIYQPIYAVTAEDDHIAPWKACYRIHKYVDVNTPIRFVRSSSGHILGIINPPVQPPKRHYHVGNPERNQHWEHWLSHAEAREGSWWEDWVVWLNEHGGEQISPPENANYPALIAAPGSYVLEK